MAKANPGSPGVQGAQALERALNLVRLVAAHDRSGARQADLIRASGLAGPTVHRMMRTLERSGFIERDGEAGRYFLGPEMHTLGIVAAQRFNLLRAGSPAVARLTRSTADSVLLTARMFWHVVCLARDEGEYPIRSQVMRVGQRAPLGITAAGIAIIAALDDDELTMALDSNADEIAVRWPGFTRPLILDLVAQTRERGFALNPGLVYEGSWAVSVAIPGPGGDCIGALSVAATEQRLNAERQAEVVSDLRREAERTVQRLLHPTQYGSPRERR